MAIVKTVVYATAKILIFLQITTHAGMDGREVGCLCYCKDTNFSANHNPLAGLICGRTVVYATAKILIFLQITTSTYLFLIAFALFMLLQRY